MERRLTRRRAVRPQLKREALDTYIERNPIVAALPDQHLLIGYWITPPGAPLGQCFGVSGYSRQDAQHLLYEAGITIDLSDPRVQVKEGITFADLDADHIAANMGPMQFRGIWYPQMSLKRPSR